MRKLPFIFLCGASAIVAMVSPHDGGYQIADALLWFCSGSCFVASFK